MERKRIFIDLDGVIADWESQAIKCLEIKDPNIREKLKQGGKIEDLVENSWEKLDSYQEKFWTSLEKYIWADVLINRMQDLGEIAFLSSGGNLYRRKEGVGNANYGKTKWVANNFNGIPLILTREKYLCASNNSILVDDTKDKIDKFIDYGGHGFLWPHPYKLIDGDLDMNQTIRNLEYKVHKI